MCVCWREGNRPRHRETLEQFAGARNGSGYAVAVIGGRSLLRFVFAASLGATLVAAPLFARSQASQTPERTLTIDFYALTQDGRAVPDLRPDELTVKVDGRTRAVRSLQLVKQADAPAADPLAAVAAAPDPFTTNRAQTGRAFILVVDDESFRPGRERPIKSAVRAFLGALTPRDQVSLWTMPHGSLLVNLTTNHDRLGTAIDKVSGHAAESETGSEAACRTRNTLQALEHMLSSITGGEGPTTVILFTASLFGPRRDTERAGGPPGMCELRPDEFQRVGHAAAQARANFYIVQPEDLQRRPTNAADTMAGSGFSSTLNPLEGMEHLAAVTGGLRMSLTRLGDATLVGIAGSTTSYYSAVIDSVASDNQGAHGLDVKTSRNGVNIRSRPFIQIVRTAGLIPKAPSPTEMVRTGAAYRDLPMRVTGFSSQNDRSGNMRLVAAAEPVDASVTLAAASVGYFDAQGRMVGQTNLAGTELKSLPLLATVVVPPGTYRVRVAAVDSTGRSGATDTDVVAEMTPAGPLRLSSLVLGLWRDNTFQPRLQFSTEPVAIAYLDMVGGSAGAAVGAFVEVARTLNGPALTTTRLTIEGTSDPVRFTLSGAIPIGGLPPGDYVVRAVVGVEGQPLGRVVRTLRKIAQ